MNQENLNEETDKNGNRKIVVGVRCYGELKFELTQEAKKIGISLSEYCENIFINYNQLVKQLDKAKKDLESSIKKLQNSQVELKNIEFQRKNDLSQFEIEIEKLSNEIVLLKKQTKLFSNPKLLKDFEKLKGSKDKIIAPDGLLHNIVYEHPSDVIEAMILSFTIK
jgi:uncharacterized protein YpuA (DUF1002 family)